MGNMTSERPRTDLPIADGGTLPVPVYDCHVILSAPDADGVMSARVSTLPEITACGRSERDILQTLVKEFKAALIRYRNDGTEIPWQEPAKPQPGETQRWIPVHL